MALLNSVAGTSSLFSFNKKIWMFHFLSGKPSTPDGLSLQRISAQRKGLLLDLIAHDFLLGDDPNAPFNLITT